MVGYDWNNRDDVRLEVVCRNCGIDAANIWKMLQALNECELEYVRL